MSVEKSKMADAVFAAMSACDMRYSTEEKELPPWLTV